MFKIGALIGLNSWTEINDLTGLEAEVQSLTKNEIEVEVFLKTSKVINIVGWENGNLVSKIYDTKTAQIVSESETEAEELDDTLSDMQNGRCNFDYCIPTVDGSLDDNYGVEFIFKPDSLNNHSENLEHFIDNVGDQLYKTAGNGYGLHVHVSNNFLTDFDKIKIQNFASIHDAKLRFIGGRDETNYQPKKMLGKTADMKKGNINKYQAVNISPASTIEFRFPVSLVDHGHIMRNLQLAYSICLYVKYHCNYANINDFNLYLNWLKSDKQFKLLSDYFNQL